jgi:threonine/homoserine/homoserine lactone efflux protein
MPNGKLEAQDNPVHLGYTAEPRQLHHSLLRNDDGYRQSFWSAPMSIELWLAFVAASSILLVIPGPTILTVISYSLAQGRRVRLPLVAAVALGDSTALLLSLLGLGTLLATSAFWFSLVKTIGGVYLLYLGGRLFRTGIGNDSGLSATDVVSGWKLFANTYAVTALNPKGIVFFVAFLPQFINTRGDVGAQLWLLSTTFVGLAIINAALYAVFANQARQLLASPFGRRGFRLLGGSLLAGAGLWALLARRPA